MKVVLAMFLLAHGLIHLMGFAKAFGLIEIEQLSRPISKSMGLVWLLAAILFIVTFILFLVKKEWWPLLAIIAVVVSQILILIFWKDAKFGTFANIVILLIGISAYGKYRFDKMAYQEAIEILQVYRPDNRSIITKEAIDHLPPVVQNWFEFSGVVGKPKIKSVRLKQKGQIKTQSNGRWMPFIAEQYFNAIDLSFIWIAYVKANAFMNMDGRDKLQNGKGEMLIKLYSLFPVVSESGNEKIDSGSLQRYLAEMCWFPSAALNDSISWETIGPNSVKASLKKNNKTVSGVFKFDENGKILSFETQRYYGGQESSELETWFIEMVGFKEFDGIKIPYKCKVTWKLKEGDFNWLNLEITDLEYDVDELWPNGFS